MEVGIAILTTVAALPSFVLMAITIIAVTLYFWPIWRMPQYPPGPTPLPFVGHLHLFFTTDNGYKTISERYGSNGENLFTIWIGNTPLVVLNSYEAVHEGLVKNADFLSERPEGIQKSIYGANGLIDGVPGRWQSLRRHALSVFREHGVGKSGMDEKIVDEISFYLEALDGKIALPFNIKDQLVQTVSNVITRIIFGNRLDYSSEQLANVQFDEFENVVYLTSTVPIIRHIPGDPFGLQFQKKKQKFSIGQNFVLKQIKSHKKSLDLENPRDFIDSFLIEMEKHKNNPETPFNERELLSTVMQMYVAGTDTTSTALHWAFLYMLLNPQIQKKVQAEIDTVIGTRNPQYADRNSMPFTQAVLTEVLRTSIAPATVLHEALEDVTVCGMKIPKGTAVTALLWTMHYDEKKYSLPHQFRPENFLDGDGNYIKPDKTFMPFGIGRRLCLAEALARTELFLFFVATLQKFSIGKAPGEKYKTDGRLVFTYGPKPYKLILNHRIE